ncbi:hypothetical protein [Pseudomonas aeruginosa]|uniref:hypothetical protein n=1 Tax=Pseudomonas aeruginosa TaxID=287 RepID=UPI001F4B7F92|nr:hypothetical protein [Pseudomonas aeruginosa]
MDKAKSCPIINAPNPAPTNPANPHIPWKNGNSVFPMSASDRLAWVFAIGEPRYEQQSSKLVDARSQGNQQQQNGVRENRRYSNVSAAELRDHPAGYRQREHHPGRHGEKRTAEHPVGKLESVFYRGHPGAEAPETQSEHEEHAGDGNTFPYAAGGHSIDPGACLMDKKRGIRDVFRVLD